MIFTDTEETVLKLLVQGLPDKEIALRINRQQQTVSNTLARIYRKNNCENRWAARKMYEEHVHEQKMAHLFNQAVDSRNWISVEDHLPRKSGLYVVWLLPNKTWDVAHYDLDNKSWAADDVSHWLDIYPPEVLGMKVVIRDR